LFQNLQNQSWISCFIDTLPFDTKLKLEYLFLFKENYDR
jgi:hypothetical protein